MRPTSLALLPGLLLGSPVPIDAAAAGHALLNGRTLAGWELVTPEHLAIGALCHVQSGGIVAVDGKPLGYLQSTASCQNFRLHAEWRWSGRPGNGGLLVYVATGPIDRNLWPRCLQIQLKQTRAGDLLPMAGATFAEKLSTPPNAQTPIRHRTAADSEHPPGEWNACDVVSRDGTVEVTINGVVQNRVTHCSPAAGRIGFQLEGTPYELRNVRLEPLD